MAFPEGAIVDFAECFEVIEAEIHNISLFHHLIKVGKETIFFKMLRKIRERAKTKNTKHLTTSQNQGQHGFLITTTKIGQKLNFVEEKTKPRGRGGGCPSSYDDNFNLRQVWPSDTSEFSYSLSVTIAQVHLHKHL